MKKVNLLSRAEMKNVMGGLYPVGTPGGNNGNPCASGGACDAAGGTVAYAMDNGDYGAGNCQGAAGCHNYCSAPGQPNFWC
ncbi:hypothetical protein [Pedobacter rhodius]|uniref:Bacteriocin n=1 Tax=Pedobacter rhodius TaxID=3004098 RepID=A0ABT4L1Z6_9SPHI|nr:hypothetical protein [Pedobacter sp. SJ11]MCZ4224447.1 hypothetical protein [Pedobacter sp. SJ11]